MREWTITVFGLWLATSVVGTLLSMPFTGPDPVALLAIAVIAMITAVGLYRSGHSLSTYWRWLRKPPREGL